jgi:rhodanese-related sulfurtransferase
MVEGAFTRSHLHALLAINSEAAAVDFSKPSLVYCHEGYRATIAASVLLRGNAGDVGILIDGIEGSQACGQPLATPIRKLEVSATLHLCAS